MVKSVGFYYAKESSNKKNNRIDIFSYVKIGDGGYDYYLIRLFLDGKEIEYDISKIKNIFSYAAENKIKISKIETEFNENLYKFLIKILWDYIYTNKYTMFNLKNLGLSWEYINNDHLKEADIRSENTNLNVDLKETDLKKIK